MRRRRRRLRGDNVSYGIRWAIDSGAAVICIAGGGAPDDDVAEAIKYAVSKRVPIISSGGNTDTPGGTNYPATDPRVFAIAAVGRDGNRDPISATAVDKGPPGHDPEYGWGVIDPVAALTAPQPSKSALPSVDTSRYAEGQRASSAVEGDTILALVVAILAWGSIITAVLVLIVFLIRRRRRQATDR